MRAAASHRLFKEWRADYNAAVGRTAIIEATRTALQSRAGELTAAYLFGSVARGTASGHSDIDLGLLFIRAPEAGLEALGFDIAYALELSLKRVVDLVVLNRASPDLVHRVLRDGVLLLETDRHARVEFEVRSRAQYFDLAPLRQQYRHGPACARGASDQTRGST
jgi:predicted nucleotidyltransferase